MDEPGTEREMPEGSDGNGASEEDGREPLAWEGEVADFANAMFERARAYGSYVNTDRALPDVRDGLKPVQRRIIFAMDELGIRADRPFKKSALTVGHVIGNYHPHGDQAVYDAMVRMAQDFVMQAPLIQGQGNFGNVDGDPAAAQRYTESRLSALASECLRDLDPEIVPYRDNYSQTKREATVLPVTFPNLLVNGARGIGWAMACEVPPHNLQEAIDAAILVLENPQASLEQIMKRLPAPDFPGGGIIVNPEALTDCYANGRGTIHLQCRYTIENLPGNQQAVVITELPYMVGPDRIVSQVVEAARAGKITEVTEMPKNLTDKNGVKVQVKCKRGGNVQKLVADLMRYTSCRQSVAFNMNVLVGRRPRVISLDELLRQFAEFRLGVTTRRLELERSKLERDLRRLLALLAALDAIDQVVKIIRSSADDDDSKQKLTQLLRWRPHGQRKLEPITDEQAQWIIDMPLKRLNQLNRFQLADEAKKKGERIDEITAILTSEHGVRDIVIAELRETRKRYGQPRRASFGAQTVIEASGEGRRNLAVVAGPSEPVTLWANEAGLALVTPRPARYPSATPLRGERIVAALETASDAAVYAFSERGICYRLSLSEQGVEKKAGKGRPLAALARGDHLVAVAPVGASPFHVFVTETGQLKRVTEEAIASAHAGGVPCFGVPAADRIVACVGHDEDDELVISTALGKALRIQLAKIRPVQTGSAGGIAGIALQSGDRVVSAGLARGDELLVVHETGQAKRVPLAEYPLKGRATGGVASASPDKPTRGPGPAGEVSAAIAFLSTEPPLLVSERGQLVQLDPAAVIEGTRAQVSRPYVELGPDDRIAFALVRSGS